MGSAIALIVLAMVVAVVLARVSIHVYGDAGKEWRFVYRDREHE